MKNSEKPVLKTVILKDPLSQKVYPVKVLGEEVDQLRKHWTCFSLKLAEKMEVKKPDSLQIENEAVDNIETVDSAGEVAEVAEVAEEMANNDVNNANIAAEITGTNEFTVYHWERAAVFLLLEEVRSRLHDFHSGEFHKKYIWEEISETLQGQGYKVTGPQCQSKFSGLKKTHRRIKAQGGNSSSNFWPYYDHVEQLLNDQGVKAESLPIVGKRNRTESECSNEFRPDIASTPQKKLRTEPVERIVQVIKDLAKESEANKERRFNLMLEEKKRQFRQSYLQKEKTIKLLAEILNRKSKT